jgi:phage replication-related protein YjqB (UPF0714/DUF867 family)
MAASQTEDRDYRIRVRQRPDSSVAIVAPHGGAIEAHTSEVAEVIAGEVLNLYVLEGIRKARNYEFLHLTSHRFDEPRCLALLSGCDHVVTIHGCHGEEPGILLGGLDDPLKESLASAIQAVGIRAELEGHPHPGREPSNVCNRGRRSAGVQIEMTWGLRSRTQLRQLIATTIRSALAGVDH